ncbi:hypothetical protein BDW59DRAFT_140396 [Aspergillus cavernicola]|uniref:Uncharacterized protein n=1 Tax=Aspergillus cavernicola TaxID=176166 RepID=A0ABR4ITL7_9EURO
MRAFWKSPWMKSKISLSDDQHVELLSKGCDVDQLSTKETPPQVTVARERYVGYGIGGAGNIRKSVSLLLDSPRMYPLTSETG